jgi:hypothetical protein
MSAQVNALDTLALESVAELKVQPYRTRALSNQNFGVGPFDWLAQIESK